MGKYEFKQMKDVGKTQLKLSDWLKPKPSSAEEAAEPELEDVKADEQPGAVEEEKAEEQMEGVVQAAEAKSTEEKKSDSGKPEEKIVEDKESDSG